MQEVKVRGVSGGDSTSGSGGGGLGAGAIAGEISQHSYRLLCAFASICSNYIYTQ